MARTFPSAGPPSQPRDIRLTVHDEIVVEMLLEDDRVIEQGRERHTAPLMGEGIGVPDQVRPLLLPGTRVYFDDAGAIRLCLPPGEPELERRPDALRIRRTRRELEISGALAPVWALLRAMDGERTAAEILAALADEQRLAGAWLLRGLAAAGAVDLSDRPYARLVHRLSKRGVLPHGRLGASDVRQHLMSGEYRSYPDAPRIPVGRPVPEHLAPLHDVLSTRRSYRAFNGQAIARADFDALLSTACGVTGVLRWAGNELKLRAYPSGGALYAVEIYPVAFAVEGLEPAVYHYRPVDNVLEVVRPGIDRAPFLEAALPSERPMIRGIAAMICLTGNFLRFEHKYGQGVYRFLAAEAGHISQNVVLTATALGLQARPWGGGFDALLNPALGLETEEEQWLLSVIVGYADDRLSPGPPAARSKAE